MRQKWFIAFIYFLAAILLFCSYLNIVKKTSYSYWDEVEWVGTSYFIDPFVHLNFDRNIWNTTTSEDQPNLTRFVFGLWLYPLYLGEKPHHSRSFAFNDFLEEKGFDFYANNGLGSKATKGPQGNDNSLIRFGDSGNRQNMINKYGDKVIDTLNLIDRVRSLNILLLSFSVLVSSYFVYKYKGMKFGLLFFLLYGFNSLIVTSGIVAHSESLFLLLFNASIIVLLIYFLKKKEFWLLIVFGIITGLCMSTKLNGIEPYFFYLVIWAIDLLGGKRDFDVVQRLIQIMAPLIVCLTVFTLLNPYVYPDPPKKIIEMFQYRDNVSRIQADFFQNDKLDSQYEAAVSVFYNFFGRKNALKFNTVLLWKGTSIDNRILFGLFIIGIVASVREILRKNKVDFFLLLVFATLILVTSSYLNLNWERYYVHFVPFFIYYQLSGTFFLLKSIKNFVVKIEGLGKNIA